MAKSEYEMLIDEMVIEMRHIEEEIIKQMMEEEINCEEIPGTWDYVLKRNWFAFNEVVRKMDDSNGKVPHEKWREYILYDMQRRHNEEKERIRKSTQSVEKG